MADRWDWKVWAAILVGSVGAVGVAAWLLEEKIVIAGLVPEVADRWARLKDQAAGQGLEIRAVSTIRNLDQQAKKVAEHKSSQKISWHLLGRAIDFQVKDPKTGKWDDKAANRALYLKVARLAEGLGFRQLGFNADDSRRYLKTADGKTYEDPYHIEFRGPYATLLAAVKAENPGLLTA